MTNWDLVGGNPAAGDPDAITAYGNMLRSQQTRVDDGSGRLTRVAGNLDSVWRGGTDSAAYANALTLPQRIFHAFSTALGETAAAADRYATVLRREQHTAEQAVAAAQRSVTAYHVEQAKPDPPARNPLTDPMGGYRPGGIYTPPLLPLVPQPTGPSPAEAAAAHTMHDDLANARMVCEQVRTAVKAAATQFVHTVEANTPTLAGYQKRLFHGGALPAATALDGSPAYAAYERAIREVVATSGPPKLPQKDPKAAYAMWMAMPAAMRAAYGQKYPDLVGNTAGVPVVDRSAANLIAVRRDKQRIEAFMHKHHIRDINQLQFAKDYQGVGTQPNVPDHPIDPTSAAIYANIKFPSQGEIRRYKQAVAILSGMKSDGAATNGAPTYLIAYEPLAYSNGHGRAIMSIGNPDTAYNTAVTVPGLGTTVEGRAGNGDPQALYRQMKAEDPTHTRAAIRYLGYNAPSSSPNILQGDNITSVASDNMAQNGARQLVTDVAGLHASHRVAGGNFTVIGHSYGSTTTADAGVYGLKTDNMVLIGSPGADLADNAGDLGVAKGHVYVGSASHDPITNLGAASTLGNDPAGKDFGAIRFGAENPGRNDFHGPFWNHSQYYAPHSESLTNLAKIATGHGAHVEHVEPRSGTDPDGTTNDPEADRQPAAVP